MHRLKRIVLGALGIGAMILSAGYAGYVVGSKDEGVRVTLLWNLADVAQAKRFQHSNISKEEIVETLRHSAMDRHAYMMSIASKTALERYLLNKKDNAYAKARLESLIKESSEKAKSNKQ